MRKRKAGSVYFVCFAALMLVAQFVIAGGHVHLPGSYDEHARISAAGLPGGGAQFPDKPDSDHDGFCSLCWAQAIAGSLLMPMAAALSPPVAIAFAQTIVLSTRLDESPSSSAFDPRAPPACTASSAALG